MPLHLSWLRIILMSPRILSHRVRRPRSQGRAAVTRCTMSSRSRLRLALLLLLVGLPMAAAQGGNSLALQLTTGTGSYDDG